MEYLIAFVGSRSGGLHKVLSTSEDIFELPDLTNFVPYSPSTNLEDGEWFCIDDFLSTSYSNDFLSKTMPLNTTTLNQLPVDKFSKIKYLCVERGDKKLFQKMLPSQFISKKWFSVSDAPVLNSSEKIISFHSTPDSIYDSTNDKLYFRDISKAKAIFKGIEELYREATQEEVTEFLGKRSINQ